MAEFSGPWPHQTEFTLDAWRRHGRSAYRTGVISGLTVSAGTGSQVVVTGGQANVDGMHYRTSLDPTPADVTLIAPANTASNPRRHLVVLRLDPSDTSNGTQGSVRLAILVGAAAASPTDPVPTQTDTGIFEMPLFSYTMPSSGSAQNPTAFTDRRAGSGAVFADGTYGTFRGTLPPHQELREWVFYNVGSSAIPFASGGILGVLTPFTGGVVAGTLDFLGGPDNAHTDTQLPTKWTLYNTGLGAGGRIIVNFRAWLADNTNPNGYSRQFVAKVVGW